MVVVDASSIILVWIVCGIATAYFAQQRGAANPAGWFVLGILLGPFGVAASLMWTPRAEGEPLPEAEPVERSSVARFVVIGITGVGLALIVYAILRGNP